MLPDMQYLLILIHMFSAFHRAPEQPLEIRITGDVQAGKSIRIALYRAEDEFPSERSAFKHETVVADGKEATVQIAVPYGNYAVAVFLDENGNGKLDKTMIGFPKEPFGFSNGFRPKTGKPKFKNCMIEFNEEKPQTTVNIHKLLR